jgi:hypothetical protein
MTNTAYEACYVWGDPTRPKKAYDSKAAAEAAAPKNGEQSPYQCGRCLQWHLGHPRGRT